MLNAIARAQLAGFLVTLNADVKATISLGVLKHFIGAATVQAIKDRKDEIVAFNKDCSGGIALSNAVKEYWRQFKLLRARADRQSAISQAPAIELKFSRLSERLRDDFYRIVPESEHAKFIIHDGTEEAVDNWDDRWDFLEGRPPLLRPELDRSIKIEGPMNYAQREVIDDILNPPPPITPEEAEAIRKRATALRERLKKLREDR